MGSLIALLALLFLRPAFADIFAFTAQDGSVHLSNVPTDSRYEAIVSPRKKGGIDDLIGETAQNYGLDAALLRAMIRVESRYNPRAVSKKGAIGLMQIMPETARRYGAGDLYLPAENLATGAKYLRDLLTLFNNDLNLALAAYNAGEKTVIRYGNRIPPFPETKRYVPRVLSFYRKYQSGG